MRIGIDVSPIQYAGTGVARYTTELVEHLVTQKSPHEYTLFYSSFGNIAAITNLKEVLAPQKNVHIRTFPIPEFVLHGLWNEKNLVSVEQFIGKQDLFLYSDWLMPPFSGKKVTTVHDLVFKKYPQTVHPYILKTQEKRFDRLVKESFFIMCDSYATQKDLLELYPIDKDNTKVIYPGVTTVAQSKEVCVATRKELGLTKPFILTVGKKEPRKNIPRLIDAFGSLKNADVELAIVGPSGWEDVDSSTGVRVIPFIQDAELYALYQEALCFVMPSLYEGFGFPLVEAMSLGCPTACSQNSSLSELGEDASLFFDPLDSASIARALKRLTEDVKLREELIKKGKKKASQFSWEKTAQNVMGVLNKLA
ncbi:MAG: glycosyltransferase family 1 protein [Patescibacteria group bacterium]|jgi:glycosyltransferase involved in cell wall biosynthesis